jgi:acyl-CoA thioesterase YciA
MSERLTMYRSLQCPRHTNPAGNIFGGNLMAIVDSVAALRTQLLGGCWVTVFVDSLEFKVPVRVGECVAGYATITKIGRTSITIFVELESVREGGVTTPVVSAAVTMVHLDPTTQKPVLHNL